MDIKKLNEQIDEALNEGHDYEMLNEEMERITENLKARLTHLCERFNYRTMLNRSYSTDQAEEIFLQCQRVILNAQTEIDKLSSEVIG